ncbi:MAG: mercuric transporter MerT family protein [Tabrizicola sp.]
MSDRAESRTAPEEPGHGGAFAALGLAGAFLASACCILPLALVTVGVSGAWIGRLTVLEPYRPFTSALAIGAIALGFRQVRSGSRAACADGSWCARPQSARLVRSVLWAATALVLLSLTVDGWARFLV